MLVCLQPLSQYKKKELYKHVDSFELADPSLFEDATVQKDLCICTLKKSAVSNISYFDMQNKLYNTIYGLGTFFEYNYKHQRPDLIVSRQDGLKPDSNNNVVISKVCYTVNNVFLDQDRCVHQGNVGYHSKGSWSYDWNINNNINITFGTGIVAIVFTNGGKENYCKYAYNYTGTNDKTATSLASKALTSISAEHLSGNYFFAIPQIDWSNIHINQKELWDKGLYDEAVLSEMGLKWNIDKTVIVKDE